MADRFIDQDETQIYGPYTSRRIRTRIIGLSPAFDPALLYLADQLDVATAAVKNAVDHARRHDARLRRGVQQKTPLLRQALGLLGRFSKHLDAHAPGAVDRKVFFTADGTARGVGRGAAAVLLGVTHITGKLQDPESGVNDRATWRVAFDTMMTELGPVVEHAQDVRTDRRDRTPEVEAARQAWMQIYLAARECVTGVLRLTGRLDRLSTIFHDLAVSANTRLTAIPEDGPEDGENDPDDDDATPAG
jgi:hypothetical protein